jgi:hypothetical protein
LHPHRLRTRRPGHVDGSAIFGEQLQQKLYGVVQVWVLELEEDGHDMRCRQEETRLEWATGGRRLQPCNAPADVQKV